MKHHVQTRRFSRTTNQLKALLNGLVQQLVEVGSIVTTLPKAKETQRLADRLIASVKTDDVATHRRLHRRFGKRDSARQIVDLALQLKNKRPSGFSSIERLGMRKGDGAQLAKISILDFPKAQPVEGKK